MPVFLTKNDHGFPSAEEADANGIIAIGGDLSCERLLNAYRLGIFPWPHEGLPNLWFCPDPRFVLEPKKIIVNQSLKKAIKKNTLAIKADIDFLSVIKKCQENNRTGQNGTWITDEMIDGYYELYKKGYAHSVEAYEDERLVGGLYGMGLGTIFFGESMFFEKSNASKICFVTLVGHLLAWQFSLIDCQAYTNHMRKFGAYELNRATFLRIVEHNKFADTKMGPWHMHMTPDESLKRILKS